MPKATNLNDLIVAIYDAGMDFRLWPVVLERIAKAFGVPSVGVARQGKTPAECWAFTIGLDPSFSQKYIDHYHSVNLIWQRSNSAPAGTVQSDLMIIPRRELVKTEFFNDFLLPQQTRGLLNAVVLCEEGRQSVITLQADRQIEEHEVDFYKLLTPHLQRAVEINVRLAKADLQQLAAVEAFNRIDGGIILVDFDAKVLFANIAAEQFFVKGQLRQSKGCLQSSSPTETSKLHALIAQCSAPELAAVAGGFVAIGRGTGRSSLLLSIAPLGGSAALRPFASHPVAIVFVSDPDQKIKSNALQLQELFGLTPAEAAFAVEISNGNGIQAAADSLSISRGTARTHLSRIFDKTGTARQAELVRVLLSAQKFLRLD